VITFLPIQIFIQFTKIVNLFFLLNAILQCIPSISTNSPLSTIVPLAFVIILAILKDLIAEIIRWREDRAFNGSFSRKLLPAVIDNLENQKYNFTIVRRD